jgi:hypothetical protein
MQVIFPNTELPALECSVPGRLVAKCRQASPGHPGWYDGILAHQWLIYGHQIRTKAKLLCIPIRPNCILFISIAVFVMMRLEFRADSCCTCQLGLYPIGFRLASLGFGKSVLTKSSCFQQ